MAASLLRQAMAQALLAKAWQRVADNQGVAGVDGVSIADFMPAHTATLRSLASQVLAGTYAPAALRECLIEKPADDDAPQANVAPKLRQLAIPTVADRVLQTAVAMVLTPILEAEFEECSFAYRTGRGVQQAVRRIERLREEGYVWVVDADIAKFFDHIPHAPLLKALADLAPDTGLINLIAKWLKAPIHGVDGQIKPRVLGLPQGSPLSPLLSNLYLDTLDEAMLDADHRLVRFADDFVILCRTQAHARAALALTEAVLGSLKLSLNSSKTRITDFASGFRFLGVNFVRSLALPAAPDKTKSKVQLAAVVAQSAQNAQNAQITPRREQEREHKLAHTQSAAFGENALQQALREANAHTIVGAETPLVIAPDPLHIADDVLLNEVNPNNLHAMPLLRTLYLVEQGVEVSREGETLQVTLDEALQTEVGLPQLDLVCAMGNISFTTPALQACMRAQIPVVFMSRTGKLYGQTVGADTQHAAILRAQVMASVDEPARLRYARQFVRAKLLNSRVFIARLARRRQEDATVFATLKAVAIALRDAAWRAETAETLAQLSGIEGAAAVRYFEALRAVIPTAWQFGNRQASPAFDPVNAMLSFGYSLLRGNIVALLNAQGLSPQIGFLHADGAGHSALASDIMEEFRALTVDAMVLELISRGRLTPDDFTWQQTGTQNEPCRFSTDATRLFIHEFEARMQAPISVRNAGGNRDPLSLRFVILAQIQHLSFAMRGNHQYAPFLGK